MAAVVAADWHHTPKDCATLLAERSLRQLEGKQVQTPGKSRWRRSVEDGKRTTTHGRHGQPQSRNKSLAAREPTRAAAIMSPGLTTARSSVAERIAQQAADVAERSADDLYIQDLGSAAARPSKFENCLGVSSELLKKEMAPCVKSLETEDSAAKPVAVAQENTTSTPCASRPASSRRPSPAKFLNGGSVASRCVGHADRICHSDHSDEKDLQLRSTIFSARRDGPVAYGAPLRPHSAFHSRRRRAAWPMRALTLSPYSPKDPTGSSKAAESREPSAPSSARQAARRHTELQAKAPGPLPRSIAHLLPYLECARASQQKELQEDEPPLKVDLVQTATPKLSTAPSPSAGATPRSSIKAAERDLAERLAERFAAEKCRRHSIVPIAAERPAECAADRVRKHSKHLVAPSVADRPECADERGCKPSVALVAADRLSKQCKKYGEPLSLIRTGQKLALPFEYPDSDPRIQHIEEAEEERPLDAFPPVLALWMSACG